MAVATTDRDAVTVFAGKGGEAVVACALDGGGYAVDLLLAGRAIAWFHGFPPGVALELVIDLFERLLDYCTDRHAGVIFFGKSDGRFTKLGFLDGRVGDMELLPAAARTLQIAIAAFHGGVLFSPFQVAPGSRFQQ